MWSGVAKFQTRLHSLPMCFDGRKAKLNTARLGIRTKSDMSNIRNEQIVEILGENEVTDLLGVNVAAANFSKGEFMNSLGQTKFGPVLTLVLLDSDVALTVGEGSSVTLGAYVWHVRKITIKPTVETRVGNYSSSRVELITDLIRPGASKPSADSATIPIPNHTTNPEATYTGTLVYNLAILVALVLIVYIYGIAFDDFSEVQLVQGTILWYLPFVFGIYGRTAAKLHQARYRGVEIKKYLFRVSLLVRYTGMLGLVFFFPFLVWRKRSPFRIALLGSAIWLVLLEFFFLAIWPSL